jgi:protease IV
MNLIDTVPVKRIGNHRIRGLMVAGLLISMFCGGCFFPTIKLFPSETDPLQEALLQGDGPDKVLMIPVVGTINDQNQPGLMESRSGLVQEVIAHLRKAEKDPKVRAVILQISSPGGTTTASDILYHEIKAYQQRTGAKVVAVLMDLAASGGYYVALPADLILAHPTTITGSVGVIMIRPRVTELMEKIGVSVTVEKSGAQKDMGAPYRDPAAEETAIFAAMIQQLGRRFMDLTVAHRHLNAEQQALVATARLFSADEALAAGLIDRIGYLDDALQAVRELAGLPSNARLIAYRRTLNANDTIYNTITMGAAQQGAGPWFQRLLPGILTPLPAGFYYLWEGAAIR